jgi:hypothetical protein
MHLHRPNSFPRGLRIFLGFSTGILLLLAAAGLATGYTYLPGKRGGVLLSGLPTLVLCACLLSVCAACILLIADHYDRRPNERSYAAARRACLKTSVGLLLLAPLVELALLSLSIAGVHTPTFQGLASSETFHSPSLSRYVHYIDPVLDRGWLIGLVSVSLLGIALTLDKYVRDAPRRLVACLLGAGLLGVSSLMLASATEDLLSGRVSAGRRSGAHVIEAQAEPAKFNAVLLTHFGIGGILLSTGVATLLLGARPRPVKGPSPRRSRSSSKPKPLRGSA